ncbi:winged helix-turn-helix domain-containing tetratricopeptide repeat protein [Novosphingobium sp. MBES04]|uniref:winged helix-turn-helix domain-containing tetratricopeptide repeat protein n=1 Tax=Novosphingobium sp. MBES04 TaxID=1206458 RepID=UPI0006944CC5|nr:tetratricopeptide repeat protein [Novosphingobium sp. MBES04]GAM04157.1 transcriptional regulator domain-containing protein [Novosphingobium sp. MBES04]
MVEFEPQTYLFGRFELDAARFELRRAGVPVHVEPQVLSLLLLLTENRARLVGKVEIIARIWDGRIVSESAVAARIKAARKAVDDDGTAQKVIRTVHARGFRFVAEADTLCSGAAKVAAEVVVPRPQARDALQGDPLQARREPGEGRPSIAVLPFQLVGEAGAYQVVADALPADIIFDLARFPWLFVIARGSSFRFRGGDVDPAEAGRQLGVRYCLTGLMEGTASALIITVSLVEVASARIVWNEKYDLPLGELQTLRPEIETKIVAGLEIQIPRNEVRLARARPASGLDAWASFHLGLDHMYRFTHGDNTQAARLFQRALECDPWFARALGGLSFTHFQNAFLRFEGDFAAETQAAHALAQRALEADRLDPFAHFNIGRCFWLEGQLEQSIAWFDQCTGLSPNFAQGVYNRGLVAMMAGQAGKADADLALALKLSPLDPLGYAMVSGRALTHLQFGELEEAADFGVRSAMMPGAHKHIALIAALTLHLAGHCEQAKLWLARAKELDPALDARAFLAAFPFAPTAAREIIEKGLRDLAL